MSNSNTRPRLVSVTGMHVAGIQIHTSNAAESNPTSAKIPALWARFYREQISKIPGSVANALPLGVYSHYESNHNGPYSLLAGVQVSGFGTLPDGITGLSIPTGKYLLFTAHGAMPHALIQTWVGIWDFFSTDSEYRRAYTFDFELYQAPDRVDIHIAVK